jgi:hypothetical protein
MSELILIFGKPELIENPFKDSYIDSLGSLQALVALTDVAKGRFCIPIDRADIPVNILDILNVDREAVVSLLAALNPRMVDASLFDPDPIESIGPIPTKQKHPPRSFVNRGKGGKRKQW